MEITQLSKKVKIENHHGIIREAHRQVLTVRVELGEFGAHCEFSVLAIVDPLDEVIAFPVNTTSWMAKTAALFVTIGCTLWFEIGVENF